MKGLKWRAYNVGTARIGEMVGAQAVTVQAAELPQALATGVVNSFMSSGATGYDSKVWESLTHFYDTRAWIPRNVTFDQQGGVRRARQADPGGGAEGREGRRGARLEGVGEQDRVVPRRDHQEGHEGAEAEPRARTPASRRSASSSPPTGSSAPAPKGRRWSTPIRRASEACASTRRLPRERQMTIRMPGLTPGICVLAVRQAAGRNPLPTPARPVLWTCGRVWRPVPCDASRCGGNDNSA